MATAKKPRSTAKEPRRFSFDLYRRVVVSFIVITAILVVVILYFSFVSANITVVPKPQTVTADITVEVVESVDGLSDQQLNGVFFTRAVAGQKEFTSTGEKTVTGSELGRVRIVNTYRRPQPLVATTRLVTTDGLLVRTSERADVPVDGSVSVAVYADDSAAFGDRVVPVGTRFTIPGLWPQIQDKIYAEAETELKAGGTTVPVVSSDDLATSTAELIDQLKLQALTDLGVDPKVAHAVTVVDQKVQSSAPVGAETARFSLTATATVQGVFFDRQALVTLAETALRSQLPESQRLAGVDYRTLQYDIQSIDVAAKQATLRIQLSGVSTIRLNSPVLAKQNFRGMSRQEIATYFAGQSDVESAAVTFSPFWVRSVPQLLDHITIRVENQADIPASLDDTLEDR